MGATHVQPSKVCDLMSRRKHLMFVGTPNLTSELTSHFPQKSYLCGKLLSDTHLHSPLMRTLICIAFMFLSIVVRSRLDQTA